MAGVGREREQSSWHLPDSSSRRAWPSSAPNALRSLESERRSSMHSINSIRNMTANSVESVLLQRMVGVGRERGRGACPLSKAR